MLRLLSYLFIFLFYHNGFAIDLVNPVENTDHTVVSLEFINISQEAKFIQIKITNELGLEDYFQLPIYKDTSYGDITLPYGRGIYQVDAFEWICSLQSESCSIPENKRLNFTITKNIEETLVTERYQGVNDISFEFTKLEQGLIIAKADNTPPQVKWIEVVAVDLSGKYKSRNFYLEVVNGESFGELILSENAVWKIRYSYNYCSNPRNSCQQNKSFLGNFSINTGAISVVNELFVNQIVFTGLNDNDSTISISGDWSGDQSVQIIFYEEHSNSFKRSSFYMQEPGDVISTVLPFGSGNYTVIVQKNNCNNSFQVCNDTSELATAYLAFSDENMPMQNLSTNGITISSSKTDSGVINIKGNLKNSNLDFQWIEAHSYKSNSLPESTAYLKVKSDNSFEGELFLGKESGQYKIILVGRTCPSIFDTCENNKNILATFFVENTAQILKSEISLSINNFKVSPIESENGFIHVTGIVPSDAIGVTIRLEKEGDTKAFHWRVLANESNYIDEKVYFRKGAGEYNLTIEKIVCDMFYNIDCFWNQGTIARIKVFNLINNNNDLIPSEFVQSEHIEIIELANEIIQEETNPTKIAKKIFDWVTHNLTAKNELLLNSPLALTEVSNVPSAINTLKTREAVCEGYTYLTAALLRAVGLPTQILITNSTQEESLHVVVRTQVNENKWILMDSYWGSGYFDVTSNQWLKNYRTNQFDLSIDELSIKRPNPRYINK